MCVSYDTILFAEHVAGGNRIVRYDVCASGLTYVYILTKKLPLGRHQNFYTQYPNNNEKSTQRDLRKHCALAVVRRSQKFRPAAAPLDAKSPSLL